MSLRVSLLSVRPSAAHGAGVESLGADYLRRCGKALPAIARTMRTESSLLSSVEAEKRAGAALFWMADLGGTSLDSLRFAESIREARDNGIRSLVLAIGPADGWSAEARAAADMRLSLGAMTLPHELAWLILTEQIYRASTILQGHPYHLGH